MTKDDDFDPRPKRGIPGDAKTTREHPSYGMISFSRGQWSHGGVHLFGSPLEAHQTTITMTVKRAIASHEHHHDWFFGKETVVEVIMSPMQYAQLLTTMGVGDGVPCTIAYADGEHVERDERVTTERQRSVDGFTANMKDFAKRIDKVAGKINETLSQAGPLKAADKANVKHAVEMLMQEVRSNIPFAVSQYNEVTDKITTAAKADIDAFVTTAVTMLGFEKLDELRQALALAAPPAASIAAPARLGAVVAPDDVKLCRQCNADPAHRDGFCSDSCMNEYNRQIVGEESP